MTPRAYKSAVWARGWKAVRRRAADKNGMAAVEFALLLPILITLFFGVVESSMALICRSDVSLMASTSGDLVSQASTLKTADVSNVYSAASTVLYPYYDPAKVDPKKPAESLPTIRITSIIDNGSGAADKDHLTGKVAWTCTQTGNGTLPTGTPAIGSPVTLPQPLMTDGGSIVLAEIAYKYTSATTKVIGGPITFTNVFYAKPRRVMQIASPTGGCP